MRTLLRLSQVVTFTGMLFLAGAITLANRVPAGRFVSLGTLGPYSVLGHRDGLLISRRIRVWTRLNPTYIGAALIIPGAAGLGLSWKPGIRRAGKSQSAR